MHKKIIMFALTMILSTPAFAVSQGHIPSNASNSSDLTVTKPARSNPGKVRIGLKLNSFSKIQVKDNAGRLVTDFKLDGEIKRTLRARIDKPNHFIVGNYHVETIPLKWLKKTQSYMVRLSFSKRYGAYGEVEEHIGNIDVEGRLEGKGGLYVLMGAAGKVFKSDRGEPQLKVVAGYGKVAPSNGNVSSGEGKKRASAQPLRGKKLSTFKPRRPSNDVRVQ